MKTTLDSRAVEFGTTRKKDGRQQDAMVGRATGGWPWLVGVHAGGTETWHASRPKGSWNGRAKWTASNDRLHTQACQSAKGLGKLASRVKSLRYLGLAVLYKYISFVHTMVSCSLISQACSRGYFQSCFASSLSNVIPTNALETNNTFPSLGVSESTWRQRYTHLYKHLFLLRLHSHAANRRKPSNHGADRLVRHS